MLSGLTSRCATPRACAAGERERDVAHHDENLALAKDKGIRILGVVERVRHRRVRLGIRPPASLVSLAVARGFSHGRGELIGEGAVAEFELDVEVVVLHPRAEIAHDVLAPEPTAEARHGLHLAQRLLFLALALKLAFGALHRVHGAVQPGDALEHPAKSAAAHDAQIHEIRSKARHGGERGGGGGVPRASVRGNLRGLFLVPEEGVAQTRRRLCGARGATARGFARFRDAEDALDGAAAVLAATRQALEALRQAGLRVPSLRGLRAHGLGSELGVLGQGGIVAESGSLVALRGEGRGGSLAAVLLIRGDVRVHVARELRLRGGLVVGGEHGHALGHHHLGRGDGFGGRGLAGHPEGLARVLRQLRPAGGAAGGAHDAHAAHRVAHAAGGAEVEHRAGLEPKADLRVVLRGVHGFASARADVSCGGTTTRDSGQIRTLPGGSASGWFAVLTRGRRSRRLRNVRGTAQRRDSGPVVAWELRALVCDVDDRTPDVSGFQKKKGARRTHNLLFTDPISRGAII